jgi:hypothetical protein
LLLEEASLQDIDWDALDSFWKENQMTLNLKSNFERLNFHRFDEDSYQEKLMNILKFESDSDYKLAFENYVLASKFQIPFPLEIVMNNLPITCSNQFCTQIKKRIFNDYFKFNNLKAPAFDEKIFNKMPLGG